MPVAKLPLSHSQYLLLFISWGSSTEETIKLYIPKEVVQDFLRLYILLIFFLKQKKFTKSEKIF